MRKILSLFAISMMAVCAWAQNEKKDVIYTVNDEVIEATISEVSSTEIKYKEWNNQYGPTFILTPQEIRKIQFSNGTEKTYTTARAAAPAPTPAPAPAPAPAPQSAPEVAPAKPAMPLGFQFNADLEGNLMFANSYTQKGYRVDNHALGGLDVCLGVGVRVGKFLYTGVASGVLGQWGNPKVHTPEEETKKGTIAAYIVPIYADVRVYAPNSSTCYPYVEVGVGGYVGLDSEVKVDKKKIDNLCGKPAGGFYFISGVGLEFKYLNIGAGYKLIRNADEIGNHGYVKIGVSLGCPTKLRKSSTK